MWEVKALLTKDSRGNCCIVSFDLIERDKLRQYIENPYLYSRVQHTQTLPQEQRGLTIPAEKKQYGILSVPCIVIDGETVFFGKKRQIGM